MNDHRLQPVKQRTLGNEVAERLRAAIRDGVLPPGTRLIEEEVARDLAVSRIPVREAIQTLVEEGLVRKVPHRGAFVYLPTTGEIEEISSLRVVLERFVVERAIERWRPAHGTTLRAIVRRMRAATTNRDIQTVYEQDYAFHHTLWVIAEHSIMLEVVAGLRSRISRFLYEATGSLPPGQLTLHADGHDRLIDVIRTRDVEAARAEMTNHILVAKERILTYCNLPAPEPVAGARMA